MLFKFAVDDEDIQIIESYLDYAESLLSELIAYKKLNFFERLFTNKINGEINIKYSKKSIKLARDHIYKILDNLDIYYLSDGYKQQIYSLLNKSFRYDLIMLDIDEYAKNDEYRKWVDLKIKKQDIDVE